MNYSKNSIKKTLLDLEKGRISRALAFKNLEYFPFQDIGFAKIDFHRSVRRGFPEAVYAPGKKIAEIAEIAERIVSAGSTLLVTKADISIYEHLVKIIPGVKFNDAAKMVYFQKRKPAKKKGMVLVITAGTSDIPIAEEASLTLDIFGNKTQKLYDAGVAGIHRLVDKLHLIRKAKVIIVIAGMEGALASLVGGLSPCPVIAVPTSIGYGASFNGLSPLLTMLNSCSPGVCVMNIDNGFGAGYFANLINK
ncbi:MAG: nickel pincer cofactor biosynthesis protein LarB [Candidatus Omnitrophota bacterium]